MRRGGGSRGGGGGGGFRSGGYRGHRTSHRHHHRYGRGRYYGRHYGYGYYGRGGGGFIIIFIVLFILLIAVLLAVAAFFGTTNIVNVNLGQGETRLFHPNTFTKGTIEVTDSLGVIQTHFFDSKPPLKATTVDRPPEGVSDFFIAANNFEFWSFYLIRGSQVDVNWSATQEVEFHIVAGKSNFDKWKDGEFTEIFFTAGASSSKTITVDKDNEYFFIFFNSNNVDALTVDITFNIRAKVFDISNSLSMETGSFSKSLGSQDYIVVFNPTDDDVSFEYKENSKIGTGTVFLIMIGIGVLIWLVIRRNKSKKKSKQNYAGGSPAGSQVNVYSSDKVQSAQQYYPRPQPKHCNACGSGILPNSTFCTECGTKV